ncbi:trans-sulfuration enzyme family protein [Streptomyces sp. NBC_01497]|uniref:trans-sulfuration enzyme family protein n=1 Tax=Streptomyces sp. NBC_01497 TaxID=2903885 RepID=UPI002E32AF82|nr:PLP-dependent transferase [Streptomyces sp. NBC_01497]
MTTSGRPDAASPGAFRTRAVHAGREDLVDLGVHAVPIDLSTTYPSRDSRGEAERLDVLGTGAAVPGAPVYARIGNPTVARFEAALADLEGCAAGVAFASGMAALTACLLTAVAEGRPHVVAVRPLYGTSDHLLGSALLGTRVTWAAPHDVAAAIRPDTGLVVVETPANPTLAESGLDALARACGDVPLLADNTFATPVLQRPAEHGARLVLHSATKFLGGHGDVLAGVVACDEEYARRLRQVRFATGATLHPLSGYLLLRGLATLPLRIAAASATAAELADRLAGHPGVTRVHYPGRAAGRPSGQMTGGGAVLSFETAGDPHGLIGAVRLITPAVSLGSVDTLIQHPASLSHHIVDPADRAAGGIGDGLLRMSVGLEDVEDLWADLDGALRAAG